MGVLETKEPKSVMAGIRRRGQWDIIGNRGDEQELEVQVKKDMVVDSASGKTNNAIDHYILLYIAIGHYLCNKCNNHIMASIPYPPYL